MRYASFAVLLVTGTALSGCAASQLDAIANLSAGCTSTAQTLNCGAPTGTGTSTGAVVPPVIVPPGPNSGNTNTATTGDVTLAIESTALKSTTLLKAVSTFTEKTNPNTASLAITTNLSTSAGWPKNHVMSEDLYGTCVTQGGIDPANSTKCLTPNTANSLGATYNEYRFFDSSIPADEELQVWHWSNSYGTHYRDNAGGDVST